MSRNNYQFTQKAITCDINCYKEGRTDIEQTLYLIQRDIRIYCNDSTFPYHMERIAMQAKLFENALSRFAKVIKECTEKELKRMEAAKNVKQN